MPGDQFRPPSDQTSAPIISVSSPAPPPTTTITNSSSSYPDHSYGSPNQHQRAKQSRHQLSAANSSNNSQSTSPTAASFPLLALTTSSQASSSSHSSRIDKPASNNLGPRPLIQHQGSELSHYPSLSDIQGAARHHQQYYSYPDYEPASQPPHESQRRLRTDSNLSEQPSLAHPFENFDDLDNDRHNFADRFSRFKSKLGYGMYNDQGQHRDAEPSQSAGNGRVHSRTHSGSNFLSGSELYNSLRWTRERPPTSRKRKIELLRSYLPDWIITIVVAGLFQLVDKVYGFRREFSLTDTSIQHTYAVHERVPVWLLGVLTVLVPALIILFVSLGISRSFWDLHNGLLGLVLAHALTLTITTIIKVCVGRPRPDLLDRCQPRAGSQNASPYGLATEIICTVPLDSSKLKDGFRSFPSGHSSTSFAGMTFLTLYIGAKMHLFDRRGHAITAWLSVLPLVAATLIAVSRTMDYRHHATDVIAGGLLGFWLAYGVYRLYYPSLRHPQCHKPYSPRIPRESLIVSSGQDVERASELGESNNDFRATTQYSEQTRPSDVAAGHYHQPSSDTPGFKRADDMEVDHETVPRI